MSDKRLLTNRTWHTDGTLFAPKRFIKENFASVVYCDYMDTSSSAGDWTGLIIQKLNNKLYATVFSQENTFPCREGFDFFSDERVKAIVKDSSKITNYRDLFNVICANIYEEETD
jgi:hypothetical protein